VPSHITHEDCILCSWYYCEHNKRSLQYTWIRWISLTRDVQQDRNKVLALQALLDQDRGVYGCVRRLWRESVESRTALPAPRSPNSSSACWRSSSAAGSCVPIADGKVSRSIPCFRRSCCAIGSLQCLAANLITVGSAMTRVGS